MWLAVTFAAIVLTGTVFMVWFLLGLLREGEPSTWYWIVPIRREAERKTLDARNSSYVHDDCHAPESKHREYYVELLENEGYAKECASGLIALDVPPVSARRVWRSIQPKHGYIFREHRF
jgi:hypothetical protein